MLSAAFLSPATWTSSRQTAADRHLADFHRSWPTTRLLTPSEFPGCRRRKPRSSAATLTLRRPRYRKRGKRGDDDECSTLTAFTSERPVTVSPSSASAARLRASGGQAGPLNPSAYGKACCRLSVSGGGGRSSSVRLFAVAGWPASAAQRSVSTCSTFPAAVDVRSCARSRPRTGTRCRRAVGGATVRGIGPNLPIQRACDTGPGGQRTGFSLGAASTVALSSGHESDAMLPTGSSRTLFRHRGASPGTGQPGHPIR